MTWLDEKLYPGVSSNWDDELFRRVILDNLHASHTILDLGAGAGIVAQMNFKGEAARVYGVDPDERVADNPYLDVGKVAWAEELPFDDESFDVVFSDNVLEHLEKPSDVFKEVHRVLKRDGVFLVKTPNKFHYVPIIARLTPHGFHRFFNRLRGRDSADTFPTRYRANSVGDFKSLARDSSLVLEDVRLIEGRPEYLRMTSITYILGWCYERIVNRFDWLSRFRVLLIGRFRKTSDATLSQAR